MLQPIPRERIELLMENAGLDSLLDMLFVVDSVDVWTELAVEEGDLTIDNPFEAEIYSSIPYATSIIKELKMLRALLASHAGDAAAAISAYMRMRLAEASSLILKMLADIHADTGIDPPIPVIARDDVDGLRRGDAYYVPLSFYMRNREHLSLIVDELMKYAYAAVEPEGGERGVAAAQRRASRVEVDSL